MKWERADAVVGAVIVTTALVLVGTLVWMSPAMDRRGMPIFADFDKVEGLAERGPVYLLGYQVGRIGSIEPRYAENGALWFRVRMSIRRTTVHEDRPLVIPQGTRAVFTPASFVGTGFISLELPEEEAGPPLEPGALVPSARLPTLLEQTQGLTNRFAFELGEVLGQLHTMIDTLTRTASIANAGLAGAANGLPRVFAGLEKELASAEKLTDELRGQLANITPAARASMDSATLLLSTSRALVQDANALLATGQPQIGRILSNLDSTTAVLHHFVRQISARPLRVLTGVQPPANAPKDAAKERAVSRADSISPR